MPELFLIPIISTFDVHDVAVRDWLNKLDEDTLRGHLEEPYGLERFFPQNSRHALKCVDEVHEEVLSLLESIDPQAVFLDISVDLVELENRYNKRMLSPYEFWTEYYQTGASEQRSSRTLYCIYIKGIINRLIRLIENKEHLPLSIVFYGTDFKKREELVPVYEDAFDKDSEFILRMARELNEIMNLRGSPKNLWYSTMAIRQTSVSYEETEEFYKELLNRIKRLLRFKVREHFVKNLKRISMEFLSAYEKYLETKMTEENMKISNILEGLNVLTSQSELKDIVIFCQAMHYPVILNSLRKEKRLQEMGINLGYIDIKRLLNLMKPFTSKNRIMQSNYDIALDITGRKKPRIYETQDAIIVAS